MNMLPFLYADVPGIPSVPKIEDITKESCVLSWRAPESDGGTPIIGYYVERTTAGTSRWLRMTKEPVSDLKYNAADLIEDTQYEFRIVAVNKAGESEPSPKSVSVLAKDPWGECPLNILIYRVITRLYLFCDYKGQSSANWCIIVYR